LISIITYFLHRLKKGVELINSLDTAKFPLLLSRIIQKLHLRVSTVLERFVSVDLCSNCKVEGFDSNKTMFDTMPSYRID